MLVPRGISSDNSDHGDANIEVDMRYGVVRYHESATVSTVRFARSVARERSLLGGGSG